MGPSSGVAASRRVTAKEGSDLVTVAANGHGTPAAAAGAGIVVKEQAAGRVGAAADRGARTFDEELGGRAGECGEEPVEPAFASDELKRPGTLVRDEFVVTFRDAEDFVDGLDPGSGEGFAVDKRTEDGAERFAKAQDAEENGVNGLGLGRKKGAKAGGAIRRDQASIDKECHKFVPGKIVGGGREVGKIEGEATGNQWRSWVLRQEAPYRGRRDITCVISMVGYTTSGLAMWTLAFERVTDKERLEFLQASEESLEYD